MGDIDGRLSNASGLSLLGEPVRYAGGLHELESGVFAWMQPNGGMGEANCGLVLGGNEAAVIDTCWDHRQARRFLDAADGDISRAPIRHVINTHSNGDHWWGNSLMPREATIITSQASRDAMNRESPRELTLIQKALAAGKWLPGPIGADCRFGARNFAPYEFSRVRLRWPDQTFTGTTTLSVGSLAVELIEVGPAHTPGDLLVYVPSASVVFAGDILFVGMTPIMWDGPADNWIAALDTITSLNAKTVVPGHGPLATPADIAGLRSYWSWLQAEVPGRHRRGLSVYRAAAELVTSREFRESPWSSWQGPEVIVGNVAAIYRNLEQRCGALSPLATVQVFRGIARLARELGESGKHLSDNK
ncbi:hypothetical protein A5745_06905 [Mycobacterium sp. IS-2888]|uniref:MBL fold metallo-hydrolase n=1 Tax=Mycobacterium sp. IS-2888 TaxID=1834159 RepID=UPI00096E6929|nr:MBL fold metallo-hydrolase [Mycobacterium sp. IS-2888]OMC49403.1 hypothetical protein A5745_06905 [Mycobacterium sp. IS-2888]